MPWRSNPFAPVNGGWHEHPVESGIVGLSNFVPGGPLISRGLRWLFNHHNANMPPPIYGVPGFGGVPNQGTSGFGTGNWGNPSGNVGGFDFGNPYNFGQTGTGANGLPTIPNVNFGQLGQPGTPSSTPPSTNGLGRIGVPATPPPNQMGWNPISNNGFASDHGPASNPYIDNNAMRLMMSRNVQ